jgi:glycerate 2-kinase
LIDNLRADDLVLCLVSGGGSALFEQPVEGVTLGEMQETTRLLLRAGAPITALNGVRKHLSAVKGGQLARRVAPASLVALILSDVVGDALDVTASGPTVPDPTTFAGALCVLDEYGVRSLVPVAVAEHLDAGARGVFPDTPKAGDRCFATTHTRVIANAQVALDAAARAAEAMGLPALILSSSLEGEARHVAQVWASIARQIRLYAQPLAPPCCILAGGETTVTVRGDGVGGRNSEFALAAALALDEMEGIVVASLATDGGDGPTDAAGAILTSAVLRTARRAGCDPVASLARNDAYTVLKRVGGLYRPGPTGTNVNDLMIAVIV